MENHDDDWDPSDHAGMRRRIEDGTIEEWSRAFPAEYGNIRLEAKNFRYTGKPVYSLADQKKAWLENRDLGRSLKADLTLHDRETGDLLDERPDLTLMRVPHYTDRGTFVYNGNNYSAASMARQIPGAYTRRQNNGGLETAFQTRSGTGRVFRVGLDPESGQFRLKIAGSNLHLYSVLKDSGVSDPELEKMWGPEILELNRGKYDSRAITKAFQKFVPRYLQGTVEDPADRGALLMDALNKAQVSKAVTDRTLAGYWQPRDIEKAAGNEVRSMLRLFFPKKAAADASKFNAGFDIRSRMGTTDDEGDEYRPVGFDGLLAATNKLLAVNRGLDQPDERSIPAHTKIYTMDKLMRERIRFDEGKIRRGLLRMVNARKNLSPIHHRVFDPYYREIITKNPLTNPIEETNPLQLVGQQRRVTFMGPGGIGSLDAVTPDLNAVQPNEMGYYSPLEGPECQRGLSEVLVSRGWVRWDEVRDEDLFACWQDNKPDRSFYTGSGVQVWSKALRVVREHYDGYMITWDDGHFKMSVTPTHRVIRHNGSTWVPEPAWLARDLEKVIPLWPEPDIQAGRWIPYRLDAGKWSLDFFGGLVYCAVVPGHLLLVRDNPQAPPYWTGNSGAAGVDVRLSWGVKIGRDGRMRRPLLNRRTGQVEQVSPDQLFDKFLKLPD